MTTEFLHLLLLIIVANGAPILIRVLLKDGFNVAVDFGKCLPDSKRIFGSSKTWRGMIAALISTPVAAWLLGHLPETGFLIAVYAVLGDLLSSFIKPSTGNGAEQYGTFVRSGTGVTFSCFYADA